MSYRGEARDSSKASARLKHKGMCPLCTVQSAARASPPLKLFPKHISTGK